MGNKTNNYTVLARKWRPQNFEDVIGQEHVTTTLQNAIKMGRVGQGYLFIGTRGVGKTTIARIMSKALNCLSTDSPNPNPCGVCENCIAIRDGRCLDVMEIDGASNRGIEEIRRLRDSVAIAPVSARYKIYIIDEVHMLTREAFNALLKTLEEPPAHVKFFFATTEPHKIPATILSRVQKFELRRVEYKTLLEYLNKIAKNEKVKIDKGALSAIAIAGNGSIRDALSVFDQVLALSDDNITEKKVVELLGWTDRKIYLELNDAIVKQDAARALEAIGKVIKTGHDPTQFILGLLRFMRNLLLFKSIPNAESVIEEPLDFLEKLKNAADNYTSQQLLYSIDVLLEVLPRLESTEAKQVLLEITILKLLHARKRVSLDEVFSRLAALETGSPLVEKERAAIYQATPSAKQSEQAIEVTAVENKEEEIKRKKEALFNKAKNESIVKQAFELFPGSKIIDVEE